VVWTLLNPFLEKYTRASGLVGSEETQALPLDYNFITVIFEDRNYCLYYRRVVIAKSDSFFPSLTAGKSGFFYFEKAPRGAFIVLQWISFLR